MNILLSLNFAISDPGKSMTGLDVSAEQLLLTPRAGFQRIFGETRAGSNHGLIRKWHLGRHPAVDELIFNATASYSREKLGLDPRHGAIGNESRAGRDSSEGTELS
jgi:hypothetical protein